MVKYFVVSGNHTPPIPAAEASARQSCRDCGRKLALGQNGGGRNRVPRSHLHYISCRLAHAPQCTCLATQFKEYFGVKIDRCFQELSPWERAYVHVMPDPTQSPGRDPPVIDTKISSCTTQSHCVSSARYRRAYMQARPQWSGRSRIVFTLWQTKAPLHHTPSLITALRLHLFVTKNAASSSSSSSSSCFQQPLVSAWKPHHQLHLQQQRVLRHSVSLENIYSMMLF